MCQVGAVWAPWMETKQDVAKGDFVKAAIAIDNWKFPIFERRLQQAGYSFERANGLTKEAMVLSVTTDNVEALGEVVKAANTEAALTGAQK